ncbi:amino acid deaminase/aldolase [Leifsonia sp. H3M29-4]|uniref:amino acid deaminase/aldolase n=1 Tax=Salinibacterium metalliresistens TaxID=3031321 RepID=UPI0023DBB0E6|nr:amino acid deaminase/aldolase [Salinibacterium metalliresistens]MDF1479449.1 amino acid deaminase/aldolase [Salinibacterium metalliresistens]
MNLTQPTEASWLNPARYWGGLAAATAELDTPFGVISRPALAHNAHDMLRRANGTTIRVASKSVRVRGVIDAVLALPGFAGVLSYTLPEALWLAETIEDVVVGYPSVDRAAIRTLGTDPKLARRVTLMVDSVAQLDVVDAVLPPGKREPIRVAIELDASWRSRLLGTLGVHRSPVHTVDEARALAEAILARPGFRLVGMMAYEAQIAGVVNRPPGKPVLGRVVDYMQRNSTAELRERRGAVVAMLRSLTELEFVNGGGTGSLERTSADPSVTEIAAGSGLFGPHLFDSYSHFSPAPAASFALSVVRKPSPEVATLLGGGWIASGPPAPDRMPQLAWPEGLHYLGREGAGEVQSPVSGPPARDLGVGDRVWLRHTKAGELAEHLQEFAVVDGDRIVETIPTYRGEDKAFL